MAGAGLMVGGALCWALLGWKIGAPLIACAPIAGSVPVIYESEYFLIIVLSAVAIAFVFGLWRLYDYIKDKNNEPSSSS
jgi:ABC-type antimicrobial peptide transport system permease subunit